MLLGVLVPEGVTLMQEVRDQSAFDGGFLKVLEGGIYFGSFGLEHFGLGSGSEGRGGIGFSIDYGGPHKIKSQQKSVFGNSDPKLNGKWLHRKNIKSLPFSSPSQDCAAWKLSKFDFIILALPRHAPAERHCKCAVRSDPPNTLHRLEPITAST